MERYHRWKSVSLGKPSAMLCIKDYYDPDFPVPVDDNIYCYMHLSVLATHIQSVVGHENYVCDYCANIFKEKYSSSHPIMWFCLDFDQIRKLDEYHDEGIVPFSMKEVNNIYQMNAKLYSYNEIQRINEAPLIWYISIDAIVSKAFYRVMNLAEYHNFEEEYSKTEKIDTLNLRPIPTDDQIIKEWIEGKCLILFADHCTDIIIYRQFNQRPSYIQERIFSTKDVTTSETR